VHISASVEAWLLLVIWFINDSICASAFSASAVSALTLLVGRQEGHPDYKKLEWCGAGMVICLERGADLHMAQLMPLAVSCFSKILIGFTFLVPANPGNQLNSTENYGRMCLTLLSPHRNYILS